MSQDRVELLRRFPLWESFSPELLRVVGEAMEEVRYEPGDAIIRRGEPGRRFSVLTAGRAEVRILGQAGSVLTVASMKEGDSFGEMSLLSDEPTSADIVAAERCETLALGREAFHRLISEHPVLLRGFVRLLSRRVKTSDVAVGVARQKVEDLTRFLQEQKAGSCSALVGSSKTVKDLQKQVDAKGGLTSPLLIRGEKGVGKAVVARLIHLRSNRKDAPMVTVDCGEITESQWGDKLLGLYDQTGATHAPGSSYMALAEGGTILLKNVTELPPAIQERLVRFLDAETAPVPPRPDVRVVATSRHDLLAEAEAGRFSPELAAILLEDVVVVPPLREHKRDIPELAAHFAEKHATRLDRKVPAIDDEAATRLVAYDYHFANAQELEDAIERAVVICDGGTIYADSVFLGPPPGEAPRGLDLLSLPKPAVRLALRLYPTVVRGITALVFAFILYQCFAVAGGPVGNLGTLLVWAVWWPALLLSFFFSGRAWCAVCPMAATGELTQRLVRRWSKVERRVPAWLKDNDGYLVMVGFFLIVWVEEATGMRRSPTSTGILLLAIISGALVTSALLPRRTWCRHLCPMGGFAGLCSMSSLVELRPTHDVCSARCKGHSCYKGDAGVEGCPMFQHVMFVDSSRDCVLCLRCVRVCPNSSPQLNLRIPARELWTSSSASPQLAGFVVLLLGLLLGQTLIQLGEGPLAAWPPLGAALEGHRFALITAVLVLCAVLPLALFRRAWSAGAGATDPLLGALLLRRVTAWAPLLGAGYTAYQLGNIPGFDRVRASLQGLGLPGLEAGLGVRVLPLVQVALVVVGLALSVAALWKIWPAEKAGAPWYRGQSLSLVSAACYALVLLLVMVGGPLWTTG